MALWPYGKLLPPWGGPLPPFLMLAAVLYIKTAQGAHKGPGGGAHKGPKAGPQGP